MTATIRLSASLKNLLDIANDMSVETGQSVRETLVRTGIKPELVALVAVNGEIKTKDYVIQESDVIRLLAVIGGG